MRLRLLIVLAAAITGAASVTAGAAAGAGSFRIVEARSLFPERAFVLSLPTETRLSASQVLVLENGKPVPDFTLTPAGGGARQFGVVLLIDASDSMQGKPISGAMAAARAFASKRAGQEQLAVIAFNRSPNVLLNFTDDSAAINDALANNPKLAYGTHIYDGVGAALKLLDDAHIRAGAIIVLSDGADTGSKASEAAAAAAARGARVRVFTVGLESTKFKPKALRRLASDANGQYSLASSPEDLRAIYATLGAKFAREYVLSYRSAAGAGERVTVSVRVKGLPGLAVSGYETPSPEEAGHNGSTYEESVWHKLWQSSFMMIFVASLVASLVALAVMVILGSRRRGTLRKRMAQFVSIPEQDEERPVAVLTGRVEDGTERLLGRTPLWGRFLDELALSGITWSPRRLVLFTFIGTFLSIWFLSVVTGSTLVALLGFVVPFAVRGLIRRRVTKKRLQFAEQLPDNLQVLSSALRAGHSFIGALSVVVEDAPEPSRSEFRRVISDEQLGVPLEDALHVVVERMESRELEQVALVAAVQRSSGGNTAEVLDRVTETIRERFELRRTVRTLTAQGRLSRWVVSILPVFLLAMITLINPGYMHVLYASTGGRVALVFAALMVIAGSLVIKRIVNIKV